MRRVHGAIISDRHLTLNANEGRCDVDFGVIDWQLPNAVDAGIVPPPHGGFLHIALGRNSDLSGLVKWKQDTLLHTVGFGYWTHQLSLVMPVTEGALSPTEDRELGPRVLAGAKTYVFSGHSWDLGAPMPLIVIAFR